MANLTGKPWTPLGAALQNSALANFIAKTFLVGFSGQVILTFGPMMGDPASIIKALSHADFVYAFFNGALGKGLVAAWAIVLSNPFEDSLSTPPATLTPGPIRAADLINK